MLRLIIIALLVWGGYYVVSSLSSRYKAIEKKETTIASQPANVPSSDLPGLPPQLQPSLDTAHLQGPAALKRWLDTNRRYVQDPRLGDIELDLAVALMRQNLPQAREIYKGVKARTPSNSPLQSRLQRLSRSLE
jgi:hypothetical protein